MYIQNMISYFTNYKYINSVKLHYYLIFHIEITNLPKLSFQKKKQKNKKKTKKKRFSWISKSATRKIPAEGLNYRFT